MTEIVEAVKKAVETTADKKAGEIKPDPNYNPDKPISFEKTKNDFIDDSKDIKPDPDYNPDKPIDIGERQSPSQQEITNDKQSDAQERPEKKGGSYAEVKETSDATTHEVHHIPADSVSELPREDGPAIKMEKEDHKQTASWGNSKEAQEYRQKQKELIDQSKFDKAIQMDIDDIHEKFGDKYDDAIAEMKEYVEKLKEEGRV